MLFCRSHISDCVRKRNHTTNENKNSDAWGKDMGIVAYSEISSEF